MLEVYGELKYNSTINRYFITDVALYNGQYIDVIASDNVTHEVGWISTRILMKKNNTYSNVNINNNIFEKEISVLASALNLKKDQIKNILYFGLYFIFEIKNPCENNIVTAFEESMYNYGILEKSGTGISIIKDAVQNLNFNSISNPEMMVAGLNIPFNLYTKLISEHYCLVIDPDYTPLKRNQLIEKSVCESLMKTYDANIQTIDGQILIKAHLLDIVESLDINIEPIIINGLLPETGVDSWFFEGLKNEVVENTYARLSEVKGSSGRLIEKINSK